MTTHYPSREHIIEQNILILNLINVKKADKAEVLSSSKLDTLIKNCKSLKGDLYDKAVFLMSSIVKAHAFASGNRRTAFIVTKNFVLSNKGKFKISNQASNARVMLGIRENYYTHDEIKEWIKNGKIRTFKR